MSALGDALRTWRDNQEIDPVAAGFALAVAVEHAITLPPGEALREPLEEIDRSAKAGLCYFTLGSAREFLKDIRRHVAALLNSPGAQP